MKTKYISFLVLGAGVLFSACSKSYLEPKNEEYLGQQRQKELSLLSDSRSTLLEALMQGAYKDTYRHTASNHATYGLRGLQLATDLMCEDMNYRKSGHFFPDYQQVQFLATQYRTLALWKLCYKMIADANFLLESGEEASQNREPLTEKEVRLVAEAHALRGIAYLYLVNAYQHTYKGSEDKPSVPLVTSTSVTNTPRAKVREIYEQIIKDLVYAVEHGTATDVRTDADKSVAAAFLAKAYAHMEEWDKVKQYALIAQEGGEDIVTAPKRSWELGTSPDILWGMEVNGSNSQKYGSFVSHMDLYQAGYAGKHGQRKSIHNLLYEQIPEGDTRRDLFLNKTDNPTQFAQIKKEVPKASVQDYDQLKFAATDGAFLGDVCYIRVQDPILLEIEAEVELGNVAVAKAKLEAFVQKRYKSGYTYTAPSDQGELRKEVRLQRRVELWCEGTNWLDMLRWKEVIDRTREGSNHYKKLKIETQSDLFLFQLPQHEIDSNPLLLQNER